jgi:hypothetical protein
MAYTEVITTLTLNEKERDVMYTILGLVGGCDKEGYRKAMNGVHTALEEAGANRVDLVEVSNNGVISVGSPSGF